VVGFLVGGGGGGGFLGVWGLVGWGWGGGLFWGGWGGGVGGFFWGGGWNQIQHWDKSEEVLHSLPGVTMDVRGLTRNEIGSTPAIKDKDPVCWKIPKVGLGKTITQPVTPLQRKGCCLENCQGNSFRA